MLACKDCFASPTLREWIDLEGIDAICSLCGNSNRRCVSVESLATRFAKLISRYDYGHAPLLRNEPLPPIVTLAQRIREDGLLVFAASRSDDQCNSVLDAVRTAEIRSCCPASGYWSATGIGHCDYSWWRRPLSDEWSGWMAFAHLVKHHGKSAIDFESGRIPNYPELLRSSVPALSYPIGLGTEFHRARVQDATLGEVPLDSQMGAPPPADAKAGRANAAGTSVLYVGDSAETAIYEMRPPKAAVIHLARCSTEVALKVFDLTCNQRVRELDPFAPEFEPLVKTASTLAILNDEFARPLAPHAAETDYTATQYLAELIKDAGYDGIRYRSAMAPAGTNYAFFDPDPKKITVRYERAVEIIGTRVEYRDYCPGWSALIRESSSGQIRI